MAFTIQKTGWNLGVNQCFKLVPSKLHSWTFLTKQNHHYLYTLTDESLSSCYTNLVRLDRQAPLEGLTRRLQEPSLWRRFCRSCQQSCDFTKKNLFYAYLVLNWRELIDSRLLRVLQRQPRPVYKSLVPRTEASTPAPSRARWSSLRAPQTATSFPMGPLSDLNQLSTFPGYTGDPGTWLTHITKADFRTWRRLLSSLDSVWWFIYQLSRSVL